MALKAPLRVMEIDLAAPLDPLAWRPAENGAHVLVRHGMDLVGRLWLERSAHPGGLTGEALETLARQQLGVELTRRLLYREVIAGRRLPAERARPIGPPADVAPAEAATGGAASCFLTTPAARPQLNPLASNVNKGLNSKAMS